MEVVGHETGKYLTEVQRRTTAARSREQPKSPCSVCGVYCVHWQQGLCVKQAKYTLRRNHCYVCQAHLCHDCKEPKHVSKTDSVYRWCPKCFAKVEKCQRCKEPLSKEGNNLLWCRTPPVGKTKCYNLICQPCGRKYGGCTLHCKHPPNGPFARWAGHRIEKKDWKEEKEQWKTTCLYFTEQPATRMQKDYRHQANIQSEREDEKGHAATCQG